MSLATAASAYQAGGLCVLPASKADKRPAIGSWKTYQQRLPTSDEVAAWFANPHSACCLVCGAVSGHLELIDFDCAGEAFASWSELVQVEAPGLLDRLVVETSPSGGWHVVYRCAGPVGGNHKLAQRREDLEGPAEVVRFGKAYQPRQDREGRWHILLTTIETRGEGGLFLCAPSPGYQLMQGDFTDLPVLAPTERELLLRCAWTLNQVPPEVVDGQTGGSGRLRPGDDFNARGDLPELLRGHGWTLVRDGANQHWCRPGKTAGTSATLKDRVLYVFSSNAAPFEANRAYSPFAAYALLEHHGDYAGAARALRDGGYGEAGPDLPAVAPALTQPAFDLRRFVDTPRTRVAWLWHGVIPRGMVALIGGKQGLGKSFLICDLAARVSAGLPMPDGEIRPPGSVLLLAREDDAGCVLLPRLEAAGADLGRIAWSVFADATSGTPLDLAARIDLLIASTQAHGFDLIVVDTFAAFAPVGSDANAAQDVRVLLDALTRLARVTGAAVLVVAHLRKSGQGEGDPMDAIAGSAQMTAGVRVAALLDKGFRDGERWLRVVKSNLGRIDERGWTWRFTEPPVDSADDTPRLAWSLAGEEYDDLAADRQAGRAHVDPAVVRSTLLDLVAERPLSPRLALTRVWERLRATDPDLKKIDLESALDDLFHHPGPGLEVGAGPKGSRLIGRTGALPESPDSRAYRLAQENPTMPYRRLAELAGCRATTAREALRDVRASSAEGAP